MNCARSAKDKKNSAQSLEQTILSYLNQQKTFQITIL